MEKIQTWAIALMIITTVIEVVVSLFQHLRLFKWKDSLVNILLGVFTIVVSLFMKVITLKFFLGVQQYALTDMAFSWSTAVILFFLSDLHYYWFHRLAHVCRFVWASH